MHTLALTDRQIHEEVTKELERNPVFCDADITIRVRAGVVTLTGEVPQYSQRCAAERAVLQVPGVQAVADELKICGLEGRYPTETEVAANVLRALRCAAEIPVSSIDMVVREGEVTLTGTVASAEQRGLVERLLSRVRGVEKVTNGLNVAP